MTPQIGQYVFCRPFYQRWPWGLYVIASGPPQSEPGRAFTWCLHLIEQGTSNLQLDPHWYVQAWQLLQPPFYLLTQRHFALVMNV